MVTAFPNYPTGRLFPGYRMRRKLDEKDDDILIRRVGIYPSHDESTTRRFLNYVSFAFSASVYGTSILRKTDAIWVVQFPSNYRSSKCDR